MINRNSNSLWKRLPVVPFPTPLPQWQSEAQLRNPALEPGIQPRRSRLPKISMPANAAISQGELFEVTPVDAAALGVAIFQTGLPLVTSGDLSVEADVARYTHTNTPAYVQFTKSSIEFKVMAFHPRYGFDDQHFYFRLNFEYNKYDLRNVSIEVLRDKSSSLYASSFSIRFSASAYSPDSDPVAVIIYKITGRWDPVGLGDVSFGGELKVRADGSASADINSEKNWVWFDGFLLSTRRDTLVPLPQTPGLTPKPAAPKSPSGPVPVSAKPILRKGSKGQQVTDLQIRLNRWLSSQGRQPLVVDGDFGNNTRSAVIAFQRALGLGQDGVVGAKTWAGLMNY